MGKMQQSLVIAILTVCFGCSAPQQQKNTLLKSGLRLETCKAENDKLKKALEAARECPVYSPNAKVPDWIGKNSPEHRNEPGSVFQDHRKVPLDALKKHLHNDKLDAVKGELFDALKLKVCDLAKSTVHKRASNVYEENCTNDANSKPCIKLDKFIRQTSFQGCRIKGLVVSDTYVDEHCHVWAQLTCNKECRSGILESPKVLRAFRTTK